jgi:crotonobetainyl-CoA:carnitine CoA-transferase CaiB-like acyl-CoA transferase
MLEHPQTIAREMVIEVEHSRLGTVKALGSPVKVSRGEAWPEDDAPRVGSPRLGEHTREILLEAGWAPEEVEGLLSSGVALESSVP